MHATQSQGGACPEPTPQPRPATDGPAGWLAGLLTDPERFRTNIAAQVTGTASTPVTLPEPGCCCGDSGCVDTFGRVTAGQDRSGCCQYCGYHSCDVCGWTDPARQTPGDAAYVVTDAGLHALSEAAPANTGEAPGTAAQVLRDAALYLERHGWIQGGYYDATTGVFTPPACLVGAIGMVCFGGPVDAPAQHFDDPGFLDFEAAVLHLDRYLLAEDGSESYEFNDAKGRRLEDVTRVLRDAASRPAEELIEAIRVIDAKNADVAAIAELLKPCGLFGEPTGNAEQVEHVDYPHSPGALYDCPACEAECFCADGVQCVHCALEAEKADGTAEGGDVR
jgi:hypothetical protein